MFGVWWEASLEGWNAPVSEPEFSRRRGKSQTRSLLACRDEGKAEHAHGDGHRLSDESLSDLLSWGSVQPARSP